ncbi:MAG: DNA repair protein RecN [Bacteroidales bacterium]|nr:DNA repair protein RecN [Bacteroidales bacterium]
MLTRLLVDNYVLIDSLEIDFPAGLTMITGETGAGKSILLGALSLILGQRAEQGVVRDPKRNCVVEGTFRVAGYPGIEDILAENEIESGAELVIRRVISPAGKSRTFVNDVPAGLPALRQLGDKLIDVHAQHENLLLKQSEFQLLLIDAYAGLDEQRMAYRRALQHYRTTEAKRQTQETLVLQGEKEQDYRYFQWEQLRAAQLSPGEQQELEEERAALVHAGEIKANLFAMLGLLQEEERAVLPLLRETWGIMQKTLPLYAGLRESAHRLEGLRIELKDLCAEWTATEQKVQDNPKRLEAVNRRLDLLYDLQHKHHCGSVEELVACRDRLSSECEGMEEARALLAAIDRELQEAKLALDQAAKQLSEARQKALPDLEQDAVHRLQLLGIPYAALQLRLEPLPDYGTLGRERPDFLFSAHKEMAPGALAQVASGGELSRIMLCMKSLMVRSHDLPTIIFDEIDLGVSGKIADKMGRVISDMSGNMQVIAITHLPQIASKGANHLLVYKEQSPAGSRTCLKQLNPQERVMEIARLLSGSEISQAAINNAKQLLTQK